MAFTHRLPLKNTGHIHLVAPLLVIIAVAIGGVFMVVSSHADPPIARKTNTYYTRAEKAHFASATLAYWSDSNRETQADNAKANIYRIDQVQCKPKKVKLVYETKPDDGYIAYVNYSIIDGKKIPAAMRAKAPAGASKATRKAVAYHNAHYYCKMHFNHAFENEISKPGYACTIFMHEYGHMLGREHNSNVYSPMYNGYVNNPKGYGGESFDLSHEKVIANSKC